MDDKPIVVVNVYSVSYSGSTWLNLMLGSHPDAFSIGELKRLRQTDQPLCMLHGHDCPLWNQFDLASGENTFLQISRITGKRYLITNNSRTYLSEQNEKYIESKSIFLVRDGRATAASYMRKNPGASIWKAARWWAHEIGHVRRRFRREAGSEGKVAFYEDLAADAPGLLRQIAEFVGISYEPCMLEHWKSDHHYLGGNVGTLDALARTRGCKVADDAYRAMRRRPKVNWDLDYYKKTDVANFVDERWKQELSDVQLHVFGLIAGGVNRRLGYSRSLDRGPARYAA